MGAQGRQEFFYSRIYTGFMGGMLLLIGSLFVWASAGDFFGLTTVHLEVSAAVRPYVLAGVLVAGLACMAFGVRFFQRSCDRRPVIVVDSEGLLYRGCSDKVIPWREIRAVELIKDEDNNSIVVTRHAGQVCTLSIDARYIAAMPGGDAKDPVYNAIVEAWRSHGGG